MLSKNISPIFIIIVIVISLFIIICIISRIECNLYKINTFDINTDKISDKVRFVYLSDFHSKSNEKYINRLLNDIINVKPDYIILGGDFIVFSRFGNVFNKTQVDGAISFINKLAKIVDENLGRDKYNFSRIYFGYGNHELRLLKRDDSDNLLNEYNKFIKCLRDNNINIIDNNTFKVSNDMTISGLSLYDGYYTNISENEPIKENIEGSIIDNYFKDINKKNYNVMIFHKPAYCEDLLKYGFDLVLSGHNHGGLIRFPVVGSIVSPDMEFFPKFNYGLYEVNGSHVIVSSGIGEHFVKIRVNNRPEICVININGTNNI